MQRDTVRKTSLLTTTLLAGAFLALPIAGAQVIGVPDVSFPIDNGVAPNPCAAGGQHGNQGVSPLCPNPYADASCRGAAIAVLTQTLGSPSFVGEGLSAASATAAAWNGYASSQGDGSGALAGASLLGGFVRAGVLESNCYASSQVYSDAAYSSKYTYATAHADVERVDIGSGFLSAMLLDDDSTVANGAVVPLTQGNIATLCVFWSCQSVSAAPNTFVPIVPGVSAIVNWRVVSAPGGYFGKTLTQGAALVVQFEPVGSDPGALVFVSYTAAAA